MMDSRVVEVNKKFYVQLMEALDFTERTAKQLPDGRWALVLYAVRWATDYQERELLFVRKKEE